MEGITYQLNGTKFRIYSELYRKSEKWYVNLSKKLKDTIIIGGYGTDKIYSLAVKNGEVIDKRAKVILTRNDKSAGYKEGDKFGLFKIGGLNVLPIICYEICFPDIWKKIKGKVDLLIHHVGFPMYNNQQANKWKNLQNQASSYFGAPLICATGNGDGVDISGININEKLKNRNRWKGWVRNEI